ncbi:5-oxoprolinase (ATP-hydrolyzing) [Rubrobacter xylanophilus DSM 9941]|uniref:5-oxoprolinase (ATP-hydrolyzing) n=1 Tax=Rubrobacter xylanophilus (strain DSM 9941 / JCM 11954 / NBRC 16129 / PRD-1) TaxID=266117 RepID=Q1AUX5_RUBXD|nr:hydantoinase/oxoprolinase family protein [Rubrobacter xylanophilus]ABG04803.1 5-oxoprolinase (ATP-hydrolyzing) [Rubrobacter xylanophilus DSM 9941]
MSTTDSQYDQILEAPEAVRNTIDIDVGGTFTDMVMVLDGETIYRKVPTTPYDLSVCFMQVIEAGAEAFGMTVDELLPKMEMVRYSTTVAMNRLIERKGPRIGLITTEGHEDAVLIGKGAQWIDGTRLDERRALPHMNKPEPLVPREMIVGVKERIDGTGTVLRPLDEKDVRLKVRQLVDNGARAFVVSLLWSHINPEHERRVKEIIREEYREYHVGYLPVILSHEVVSKLGEYERTMTAILDAYLQRLMQLELSSTWDALRDRGYTGPFFMVHNTGGCADVFKTTASRTYNGGPVAGLIGAREIARRVGIENVVCSDVGGTSFDLGLVMHESVRNYEFNPVVDRWMVATTMLQSVSIGAGGGSIAWINRSLGNRLEVGPQSAGSYPGPVCYNLGGTEPTTTDADLILGYINPDNYFGGKMKLNKQAAERAIKTKIADQLGVSTVEAAALIRRIVDEKMASAIRKEVVLRGYRPTDFLLFAFGGGGPTHVAGYMGEIPRAAIFPFSPVFSAYGSSVMDVMHIYERSHRMTLIEPVTQQATTDYETFNNVVKEMMEVARQELEAEGLPVDKAVFGLELDMLYGGQIHSKRSSAPDLFINSEEDVWRFYKQFEREFSEAFSPLAVNLPGGVYIDTFVLRAAVPGQELKLERYPLEGKDPSAARKGSREAYWPEASNSWVETEVYDLAALKPGNVVAGPALIESEYTTVVVPPTKRFRMNEYAIGLLEAK